MKDQKFKYYALCTIIIIGIFTMVAPMIYYTFWGKGMANLLEDVRKKYYPSKVIKGRRFFDPWW